MRSRGIVLQREIPQRTGGDDSSLCDEERLIEEVLSLFRMRRDEVGGEGTNVEWGSELGG